MTRSTSPRRSSLALAALLLPLSACASGPGRIDAGLDNIQTLTRQRDYTGAAQASVDLLSELPEDSPRYGEVIDAQHRVSMASQLDRARDLTLAGDDDKALEILTDLEDRYPGVEQVAAWRERTRRELADRWFSVAREAFGNSHFEAAREAYKRVLKYDPEHPVAALSLDEITTFEAYRAEMGADYYSMGVRGVVDVRLSEARNSFQKSLKYAEDNPRATSRIREVDREQAKSRADLAKQLASDGRFAAAAQEYAAAVRLDPDSEELAAQLELYRGEAKAFGLLSDAEFMVLRGQVDRAVETLKEGAETTTLQAEAFEKAMAGIEDARVENAYADALDLEHDFRFPEAVEAYGKVLEMRPAYKSTRARIDSLTDYIADAERLYAEADAATTDEAKLEKLLQIDVFWPEYKDVAERIRKLR